MQRLSLAIFLICIADGSAALVQEYPGEALEADLIVPSKAKPLDSVLARYYTNSELESHLKQFVKRCSSIARLEHIGTSVQGLPLTVLVLCNPIQRNSQSLPAFRYVGNLHGDEPTGRQLLLGLAEWLCERRNTNGQAAQILNSIELHLLPTANPDGYAMQRRSNGNGIDLNRDFPDVINKTTATRIAPPLLRTGWEQPETVAIMDWSKSRSFVASAAMHEGALVANYPWDANETGEEGYSSSPDDSAFRFLARTYASSHTRMMQAPEFAAKGGITNGAEWYQISGSMQDWTYVDQQCLEVTLELSERKHPPHSSLPALFNDNLLAMLALPLAAAWSGASGFVRDEGGRPLHANISVTGVPAHVTSSTLSGDFYRVLAPGEYTLVAEAIGYKTGKRTITVPSDGRGAHCNFTLSTIAAHSHGTTAWQPKPDRLRRNDYGKFGTSHRKNSDRNLALIGSRTERYASRILRAPHMMLWAMMCAIALVVYALSQRRRRYRYRE